MSHNFVKQTDGSIVCSNCGDERAVNYNDRNCPHPQYQWQGSGITPPIVYPEVPQINMYSILLQFPADSIVSALNEDLPFKIPTYKPSLISSFKDIFYLGDWNGADSLNNWVDGSVFGSAESSIISRDDRWIGVISGCIGGIQVLRDQKDESSNIYLRPDCSLTLRGALFLKAETKFCDANIDNAVDELTYKFSDDAYMVFPSGGQSMIGIVSTLNIMQMHIIYYDNWNKKFKQSILKSYTVSNCRGRVEFLVDLFKTMRWVSTIEGPTSRFHLVPNVRMKTTNGHHLTWIREGLLKEFKRSKDMSFLLHLAEVYERKCDHVEWGYLPSPYNNNDIQNTNGRAIIKTRIGLRVRDAIMQQLIGREEVVAHVKCALDELHALGYAHCDVSVENVFYDKNNNCAFLDDLEYLCHMDSPPPPNNKMFGGNPKTSRELDEIQFEQFKISIYY